MKANPRDIWDTPPEAMPSLLRHLPRKIGFYEPCAGAGVLAEALEAQGHKCFSKSDIFPRKSNIALHDAIETIKEIKWPTDDIYDSEFIITNPPFSRESMCFCRELIEASASKRQSWFLLPLAFGANVQNAELMRRLCLEIVTIGRLKWIPNTKHKESRDMAWFLFSNFSPKLPTRFFPYSGVK